MILRRLPVFMVSLACLFTVPIVSVPFAHADTVEDVRKTIQASEDKENTAVAKKDINGAFSACAPDFKIYFKSPDNVIHPSDTNELKRQMQIVFKAVQAISVKNTVQKVTVKANEATVRMTGHTVMTLIGPKGGKSSTAVVDFVEEQVWLKTKNVWMRKSANVLSQTLIKDGKPFSSDQSKQPAKQK